METRCTPEAFLKEAPDHPELKSRLPLLQERLSQGDTPCLFFDQGRLVHMAWWGPRRFLDPDYELGTHLPWPLPGEGALIYDCWTPPSCRGRGYYPRALRQLATQLLTHYPHVWIYALEDNTASRRGIEKAGFRAVALLERTCKLCYLLCQETTKTLEDG